MNLRKHIKNKFYLSGANHMNTIQSKYNVLTNDNYSPVACDIIAKSEKYTLSAAQIALLDKCMLKDLCSKDEFDNFEQWVMIWYDKPSYILNGVLSKSNDIICGMLANCKFGLTKKQYALAMRIMS